MRAILLALVCLLPASAGAGHAHTYQPTEKWEWERCAKGWRHRVCHQDRCACSATRGYKCGVWSACDLANKGHQ